MTNTSHQVIKVLTRPHEGDRAVGGRHGAQGTAALGMPIHFSQDHRSHGNRL